MTDSQRLHAMLAEHSAKRGQFTLASGRTSTLYIDARRTTMRADGLALIGALGLAALDARGWAADAVGGLTLGADPIAYAVAHTSALRAVRDEGRAAVHAFTVRKEAKQHGTGRLIEGAFAAGQRVVVVEDVITTGGSALKAVEALESAGATILGVLAVVDREEGGRERLEAAGLEVHALARAADVVPLIRD